MTFFDINCMLGPTNTNREPAFQQVDDLLCEMNRLGIHESLVYASAARFAHPADGNAWLMRTIADQPRLHPCWVGLPPGNGELDEPEALVAQMQAQEVRALRLFPAAHRYPLLEQPLRPLLRALSDAKIPLLIDSDRSGWSEINPNWRAIFEIADKYPDLMLVLMREGGTTARVLYPVWEQYPNIKLDTSYIQESRIIEDIAERFGTDRLMFGAAMPQFDAGGPLSMLQAAALSTEQRGDVSGNNARHLLGLQTQPSEEEESTPAKAQRRPEWPCGGSGFRVFDTHGHIGRWEHKYYSDWSAQQMVAYMDRLGIERFAVSDILAIGPDFHSGNTRIGQAIAEFPDRLVGYAVYNPNYQAQMRDEMKRAFDELGCKGIKLHCALHDMATTDRSYELAFQTAHERRCPVLCHVNYGPSPEFFKKMLAEYSDCQFIYAHIGGTNRATLEPFLEVARERPNFFFELSLSVMARGVLAWLTQNAPVEQILYGSDHPLNDFAFQLGRVLWADIDDVTKQKVLWDNAARIFNV